ncbi:MAG: type II secretion system protein [Planctomycetes bacterium]|nr:type II secretion system protein [Planctomycetota bacterium]MBI3832779.1 type II secretion system protein [Planctomycetota bacterium]
MGKENLCSTGNPPQSPLVEKGGVRKENLCDTVKRAFTLVEMLVVIAIISLLLAVLLPAFATVREKAKVAQTQAQFTALDTGLRVFQQEAAIGGTLPPSSGDNPTPNARQKIKDPDRAGSCTDVRITGAQLLVHAMMGADGLGTPGFKDIGTSGGTPPANGLWSDDTCGQNGSKGLYELDPTSGATRYPRYPSTGAYVDDKMRQHAVSLQNLVDTGKIVGSRPDRILPQDSAKNQAVFLDAWDHPVLYYKASPSSLLMVTDAGKKTPGIFWQEDNSIITGSDSSIAGDAGVDFGAGVINGGFHDLRISKAPLATEEVAKIASTDDSYKYSFARFIIDPTVKTRPTPVRKDSYLLISAGPDARYGTGDDVVNWTKKTD